MPSGPSALPSRETGHTADLHSSVRLALRVGSSGCRALSPWSISACRAAARTDRARATSTPAGRATPALHGCMRNNGWSLFVMLYILERFGRVPEGAAEYTEPRLGSRPNNLY